MAEMFEKDVAGFVEERDETLEPGEIASEATDAPEAEAADAEEVAEAAPPRRREGLRTRPTRPEPERDRQEDEPSVLR